MSGSRRAPPTSMTPERWARLEPLIDEALDVAPERRAAYYDRAMPDDAILRAELEQLVVECERCDSLLDVGAGIHFAELLGGDSAAAPIGDDASQLQASLGATYALEGELAGGGMSRVFVAHEPSLDRRVVIKVLTRELAAGISAERFEREIKLAASLQQANIVPVLTAGRAGNVPYYTMPLVEGRSLRERLEREGALPIRDVMNILRDVVRALSYAHERGVVHRDIKPGNILLSGGAAVVTDFGIAKALSAARADQRFEALTQAGGVLGTPMYMSPEQASGDPNTDARADIYALGAVAYEMLAGKPPFVGRSPRQLLSAHMTESPAAVDRQRPGIPAPLTALVMRCLEKRAGDRPQSAEEVSKELEAIAASGGELGQIRASARGLSRRHTVWVALSALVLVSAAGVVALRRSRAGELNPNRIVVAPFINRTGDSTLDVLGPLIAEGVTRGLDQLDSVTVVSSYAGMRDARGGLRRITSNADLRAIGEETRAGRVISGSYSRQADSLRFNPQIIDARDGHVVLTLDVVVGSAAAPSAAIERLRDNVAAALQVSAARPRIGTIGQLPNLGAYRELITAFETNIDGLEALPHLIKVGQLDSSFTLGLYWLAISYSQHGYPKQADSIVQVMAARRARFSPVEAELFASADGFVHSEYQKDLIAARQLFKRDSIGINAGGVVANAFNVNRPREALTVLGHIHRLLPSNGVFSYWIKTAAADHMIADYRAQLAAATAGRKELGVGVQVEFFDQQVRALAALRDTSRLRQNVDSFITAWNPALDERRNRHYRIGADPSELYLIAALELSAHGLPREALAYANTGLAWNATRAGRSDAVSDHSQRSLAELLMFAGRLDSARAIWTKLAASDTLYTGARIQLAIIAARKGDSVSALQTMHVLDSLEARPYAFGRPLVLEARIAAALGRKDEAVAFLQRAMDAGAPFDVQWDCSADFQGLRDFVPFKVLLAPKG